jgi:tetratricopeptide (TPR) repeat protein
MNRGDDALADFDHAARLLRAKPHARLEALVLLARGRVYDHRGQRAQAKLHLTRALELIEPSSDYGNHARVLNSLAGAESDPDVARAYLEQAVDLARQTCRAETLVLALGNLGNLLRRLDRLDEAVPLGREAITAAQGMPIQQAISMVQLAVMHRDRGELDAAAELLSTARQMLDDRGMVQWVAMAEGSLGGVALDRGDHAAAVRWLEPAIEVLVDRANVQALFRAELGTAQLALGDTSGEALRAEGVAQLVALGVPEEELRRIRARLERHLTSPAPRGPQA